MRLFVSSVSVFDKGHVAVSLAMLTYGAAQPYSVSGLTESMKSAALYGGRDCVLVRGLHAHLVL